MTWIAYTVSGASYEVSPGAVEDVLAGACRFIEGSARITVSVDHDPIVHKAHIAVQHIVALEETPRA